MTAPAQQNGLQKSADLVFLALTAWREARGQSDLAVLAVCYSVLNRIAKPKWWGHDVQSVLFRRLQYSSLTDPHDRQLTTWPLADDPSWKRVLGVAALALSGDAQNPVPTADSYYDVSIPAPYWATPERFVAAIGDLRFYNVDEEPKEVARV